jgi:hypothetical protein
MQPEHLCKIKNICDALVAAGFDTLDKQAEVLGLPRSTTWTILRGTHKKSGLSATLLTRMLKSLRLPPPLSGRRSLNTLRRRLQAAWVTTNFSSADLSRV